MKPTISPTISPTVSLLSHRLPLPHLNPSFARAQLPTVLLVPTLAARLERARLLASILALHMGGRSVQEGTYHWGLEAHDKEATRHGTCVLHIIREGLLIVHYTLASPSRLFPFWSAFLSESSDPSLAASFTRHPSRDAALPPRRHTFPRVWDASLGSVMRHHVAGPSCICDPSRVIWNTTPH